MKRLGRILFITVIISCSKRDVAKEYYSNGILKNETMYYTDIRDGSSISYYPNGKIKEIGYYINDTLFGPYKEYDSTGNVEAKGFFWKGKSIGSIYYYSDNKLITYNERGYDGQVYYVLKYNQDQELIKEDGICLYDSGFPTELLSSDVIKYYFNYAQPPAYRNVLSAFVDDEANKLTIVNSDAHIAVVNIKAGKQKKLLIASQLVNQYNQVVCGDTIIKFF